MHLCSKSTQDPSSQAFLVLFMKEIRVHGTRKTSEVLQQRHVRIRRRAGQTVGRARVGKLPQPVELHGFLLVRGRSVPSGRELPLLVDQRHELGRHVHRRRHRRHQEIPRRFDMHQFMSTYKIQKCVCRHFLFSSQVYVEIFFTCRHDFFSCQHIYLELSIVNILDEPFDMHFIHSTCSLYL